MSPDPDGIERPHLDGLPPKLRKLIIEEARRRNEIEPKPTPEFAERLGRLIRQFRIADQQPGDAA